MPVYKKKSRLLDYNSLNPLSSSPIPSFNEEIIYYDEGVISKMLADASIINVDTILYNSYDSNDLRKAIFFQKKVNASDYYYKGSYSFRGSYLLFDGIATDEMYLTRAECSSRAGNVSAAMADLNTLMIKRWRNTVAYSNITANNSSDALAKILTERRKELCFRNLRWSDLRRLNLGGANITLKRIVNNTTYTLSPNDLKWVVLIPQDVINYSGMKQNQR